MAVSIRLMRVGKKNAPQYRVVVIDSRNQRDGKFVEIIGYLDPRKDPPVESLNIERYRYYLERGAIPSKRVRAIYRHVVKSKGVEEKVEQ